MTKETHEMLEEEIVNRLIALPEVSDEKKRSQITKELEVLLEQKRGFEKDAADALDKEERRRIEEERYTRANEIEEAKNKVSIPRAALEISKVLLPVVVSGFLYDKFQTKVMEYEEEGRVTSTSGRTHCNVLSRFWK